MHCVFSEGSNPDANQQVRNAAECFGIDLQVKRGERNPQPMLLGEGGKVLAIGAEQVVTTLTRMPVATGD